MVLFSVFIILNYVCVPAACVYVCTHVHRYLRTPETIGPLELEL